MLTDQEKSEQIERYLVGGLSEQERQAFEAALQDDPALAGTLALHRALRQSLGNRQRRQLLDVLADVAAQEEQKRPAGILRWLSPFRMAAAAAVLVLVVAVGAWLFLRPRPELPMVAERPAAPPQPTPDSALPATPPATADKPPVSGRLTLAERRTFEPNPALDPLAGTLVRGGGRDVSVTQPENDAVLPFLDGNILFKLMGRTSDETVLTLHIYNNREADFAAGSPAYRTDIPVRDHVFTLEKKLNLTPGRYYAVLYVSGEEEPVAVLRFFVGSRK